MSEPATIAEGFYEPTGFSLEADGQSLFVMGDAEEEGRNPRAPVLRPHVVEWCDENLAGRYGTGLDYERLTAEEGKMSFEHQGTTFSFQISTMVQRRIIRFEIENDMIHFKMKWC